MAVGFGGAPPLISTLTGFARGITEAEKRKQEQQRQAMLDSLRRAQDRRAEEQLRLSQERLNFQREQAAQRAEAEEAAREQEASSAEEQAALVSQRASEIEADPSFTGTPFAARLQAVREIERGVAPFTPEPEEEPSERDSLLNTRTRQQIAEGERDLGLAEAEDAILELRPAREIVENAADATDAGAGFDALQEQGQLPGVSRAEFLRVWEKRRQDADESGRSPAPTTQRAVRDRAAVSVMKLMQGVATPAVMQGTAKPNVDLAVNKASEEKIRVVGLLERANEVDPPLSDKEIQYLRERLAILRSIEESPGDALRELGIVGGR